MVTEYDVARLGVCCSLFEDLAAFAAAVPDAKGTLRPRVRFYTLSQWAAAFSLEEEPDRVLGGYLLWYTQFRHLVNLIKSMEAIPVLVGPDGGRLKRPVVEVVGLLDGHRKGDLVATVALLRGWKGESGLPVFHDPICVSVAVHPRQGPLVGAALVWNTGLDSPKALLGAAEKWARKAGAAEVFRDAGGEGGCAEAELIPTAQGFHVALPMIVFPSEDCAPRRSNVIGFEDARRRILQKRSGFLG